MNTKSLKENIFGTKGNLRVVRAGNTEGISEQFVQIVPGSFLLKTDSTDESVSQFSEQQGGHASRVVRFLRILSSDITTNLRDRRRIMGRLQAVTVQTSAHTKQHFRDGNGHIVKRTVPRQPVGGLFESMVRDLIEAEESGDSVKVMIVYDDAGSSLTVAMPGKIVTGRGNDLVAAAKEAGFAVEFIGLHTCKVSGFGLTAVGVTLSGAIRRLAA